MKNEVASLMKCGEPHENQSARTSCEHSTHFMTTKLSLHVCNANTSWIEIAITFSEKSRKPSVFLLFFTLLAEPTRRPCHTQPHRLLTGSEHRTACGANSSKQWCIFVCFFALRRLNTSVRTAGLYSARRRVLSRIISMLFATIPHSRIFDTKVALSFMDYFIKKRLPMNIFPALRAKKRTDKTMTNFVGSRPTVAKSVFSHTSGKSPKNSQQREGIIA